MRAPVPACIRSRYMGTMQALLMVLALVASLGAGLPALAQNTAPASSETPAPAISTRTISTSDAEISSRIRSIFAEIIALREVKVRVSAGVVTLSGTVPTPDDIGRAEAIAQRVSGVVTVQNDITRNLDVNTSLTPTLGKFGGDIRALMRGLPLFDIALAIGVAIAALGYAFASIGRFWRTVTPNPFLAELAATFVRFAFVTAGIVVALEILGATALLGGVLGGAGVIGIALGFAVRDTVDNYVSSVMLSLRQPFRANDHVVIEQHEGRVIRLTSRATILMTLDGNHLRIPNSIVFKAVILNYTRNPQRRFTFDLGVDADDNPLDAIAVAVTALQSLPFVLTMPKPQSVIQDVGDSNILLRSYGWLDQNQTDFAKGRSLAIHATAQALTDAGFALPEPIYRLRFDDGAQLPLSGQTPPDVAPSAAPAKRTAPLPRQTSEDDVSPDTHIKDLVDQERTDESEHDLLDSKLPSE